jgi:hypothetical protein
VGRQLLAVEAVPFLTTAVTLAMIWLPVAVLTRHVGPAFRVGGMLAALVLACVAVAAASAGAAWARSVPSRLGLTLAAGALAILPGLLLKVALAPGTRGPGWVFALVGLTGAACLQVASVRRLRRRFDS